MKLNLALKLPLLTAVLSFVASTACGDVTGTTGTTGGGAGGEGGGQVNYYPVCAKFNAMFKGTLDEMPFSATDQVHLIAFDQGATPPTVDVNFDESGNLILHWSDLVEYGKPKGVVGTLMLPGQSTKRKVLPGSTMILQDNFYYKFDLILDTGHLLGCAYST